MSRNTVFAVVLLALGMSSVLPAADRYTGTEPTTITDAFDKRTEIEKLQDQLDDLASSFDLAHDMIYDQQQQINALQASQNPDQNYIDVLKSMISVDSAGVTITASSISLDAAIVDIVAASVDIDAGLTEVSGTLECNTLISESVDAESYTPGAGNVW